MLNKKKWWGGGSEMTLMLVHASYSLPKWQAVKLTFASCKMVDKLAQKYLLGNHWYLLRQVYIYTYSTPYKGGDGCQKEYIC